MEHVGHSNRKTITILLILLVIFAIIFFLSFFGLQKNQSIFGLGVPPIFENWMIMILCVIAIAKIIWELYEIEIVK